MCAGQGRDVIDVVATHPKREAVSALLVELHPDLVAFARHRVAAAGVDKQVRIVEGDAARSRWYADDVPADLVLVCGVFGNISAADRSRTIQALPGWCKPGAHVIWTRHRRAPDATPAVRAEFAAAGFTELAFVAPEDTVMAVGHHRLDAPAPHTTPFDPDETLFDFVGDGHAPA
jgi:microcompartment protein CcmK/EutM